MSDEILKAKIEELEARWHRLSTLLAALAKQRDEETRVEEKIRLDARICETEGERAKVEERLSGLGEARLSNSVPDLSPDKRHDSAVEAIGVRPVKIFYSYAHEDESLRDELDKHLSILKRQGIVSSWHDRMISAGSQWEDEIHDSLDSADIILLLISPSFVASEYCWGSELTRSMERHLNGEATVVPVILRDVDWAGAPFGNLQALPKDARPVTQWEDRDQAFAEICRSIRRVAADFRK